MDTGNIKGRLVETEGEFLREGQAGDWWFRDTDHLAIQTPVGVAILPIDKQCREEWGGPCWNWDGNRDVPTVTPSILIKSAEGEWHGYMTKGELVTV